jgi:CBS domain-containing protein
MLKHGVRHLPVTDGDRVVGVVSDTDLMGLERTTPFALRAAIERAPTARAVASEGRVLGIAVRELVHADVDPSRLSSTTLSARPRAIRR